MDKLYRATENGQEELSPEEEAAIRAEWAANEAAMNAPKIPQIVTMRQARLAMYNAGILANLDASIAAADEYTKITWEYAQEVHRNNPYVISLGASLGLTSEQIDNLFIEAAKL